MTRLPWQPLDSPEAIPFWEGASRRVLTLPWCDQCSRAIYYPRAFCPRCHHDTSEWRQLSGRGAVYSFGIEHRTIAGFDLDPPFVIALIDLDEGARMTSNVLVSPESVTVGARVEAVFVPVGGRIVPRFRLT